ncbi:type VII secretion protein EccE [Asanoa sp. WMMD1127]|uniref:type VII secretion protein EccE n=1 Tax=Asanoa sp. WMMD1127 TaxID=3016107 RepID=UPI002416259D|nr:type VII secretion protein EccE [Asanoa sp. WMMD1127]MDG4821985.1 type VII secretion protein EccE [Asanoa sp. WMMD1127]
MRTAVWRLVVAEIAIVAIALAAFSRSPIGLGVAAAAAVLVAGFVYARRDGRWWMDGLLARRRWRRRRGAGAALQNHSINGYDDRGTSVGIGCDEGGWFAAVAIAPPLGVSGARGVPVPVSKLAELLDDPSLPLSGVQVVSWAAPAPHHLLPSQVPSVASYQQLATDLLASGPAPVDQRDWVAVRLDVADAAVAAHRRGGGVEGVHRAVAAALGRVSKALNSAGVVTEILGPQQLAAAVRLCAGVDGRRRDDSAPAEDWTTFYASGLHHLAFEVQGLPPREAPLSSLLRAPAAQMVLSVEMRPRSERGQAAVLTRTVVRMAAPAPRLPEVARTLAGHAGQLGLKLRRLDGWQGPAAYASAPTGGGPW